MSTLKICPSCGKVISYNSHFSAYICEACGYELTIPRLLRRNDDDIRRICHFDVEQCDMGCYGCVKRTECNHNIFGKLSAYEDAEESGRLIRFPCKPGDEVYYFKICLNSISKGVVKDVKYYYKDNTFVITGDGIEENEGEKFTVSTVYKTRVAAEVAQKSFLEKNGI